MPESPSGERRELPRRKRGFRPDGGLKPADRSRRGASVDLEFDPAEFAEFLEADEGPQPIDPTFREQLREQLWQLVRDRVGQRRSGRLRRPR